MADYIDRQAAIDALNELMIYRPLDSDRYVISACLNKIVGLPSADVVEVVRCKDCLVHGLCRFEQGLGLDGFCSKGERKDE